MIDDWSKGMESDFSFHDAKERFWGHVAFIGGYCRMVMSSVTIVKIIIREKDCPSNEMQSPSFVEGIAPTGPFLLHPYRSWERLLVEPDSSKTLYLLLKEYRQASCVVSEPERNQIATAKVACLVYSTVSGGSQASWTLNEIEELWPRTSLQLNLWTWYGTVLRS